MKQLISPCPSCGGQAVVKANEGGFEVACVECDSSLQPKDRTDPQAAIDHWNERAKAYCTPSYQNMPKPKLYDGEEQETIVKAVHRGYTTYGALYTEFWANNAFSIEAGTTGYQGGDSGHGGHAHMMLLNIGGSDVTVTPYLTGNGHGRTYDGVAIDVGGDDEIMTLAQSLRFAADVIEYGCKEIEEAENGEVD